MEAALGDGIPSCSYTNHSYNSSPLRNGSNSQSSDSSTPKSIITTGDYLMDERWSCNHKQRLDWLLSNEIGEHITEMLDRLESQQHEHFATVMSQLSVGVANFDSLLSSLGVVITEPSHNHHIDCEFIIDTLRNVNALIRESHRNMACLSTRDFNTSFDTLSMTSDDSAHSSRSSLVYSEFNPAIMMFRRACLLELFQTHLEYLQRATSRFTKCCNDCPLEFKPGLVIRFVRQLVQPFEMLPEYISALEEMYSATRNSSHPMASYIEALFIAYESLPQDLAPYRALIPLTLTLHFKVDELRAREASFHNFLKIINKEIVIPLEDYSKQSNNQSSPIMSALSTDVVLDAMFGGLSQIEIFQETHLSKMESALSEHVTSAPGLISAVTQLLSDTLFALHTLYASFISRSRDAKRLLLLFRKSEPIFNNFLVAVEKKHRSVFGGHTVEARLDAIMQHLTQYKLHVNELAQLITQRVDDDPQWKETIDQLKGCERTIKWTCQVVNERIRLSDDLVARLISKFLVHTLPVCISLRSDLRVDWGPTKVTPVYDKKLKAEDWYISVLSNEIIEFCKARKGHRIPSQTDSNPILPPESQHIDHIHMQDVESVLRFESSKQNSWMGLRIRQGQEPVLHLQACRLLECASYPRETSPIQILVFRCSGGADECEALANCLTKSRTELSCKTITYKNAIKDPPRLLDSDITPTYQRHSASV